MKKTTSSVVLMIWTFTLLIAFQSARAAISDKSGTSDPAMLTTKDALDLPLSERLGSLRAQGQAGYRNLVKIMFDRGETLEYRWRAVTAIGRVGGSQSLPLLHRALLSPEWFMRNAALVSLSQIDREQTLSWSRKFLDDKALIVRSAAVDELQRLNDFGSIPMLWSKLYAKENFRGNQSLFLRRRIVEALAQLESPGHEQKFIKVLTDSDETLQAPAISALERLTHRRLAANEADTNKRAAWLKWAKQNGSY